MIVDAFIPGCKCLDVYNIEQKVVWMDICGGRVGCTDYEKTVRRIC